MAGARKRLALQAYLSAVERPVHKPSQTAHRRNAADNGKQARNNVRHRHQAAQDTDSQCAHRETAKEAALRARRTRAPVRDARPRVPAPPAAAQRHALRGFSRPVRTARAKQGTRARRRSRAYLFRATNKWAAASPFFCPKFGPVQKSSVAPTFLFTHKKQHPARLHHGHCPHHRSHHLQQERHRQRRVGHGRPVRHQAVRCPVLAPAVTPDAWPSPRLAARYRGRGTLKLHRQHPHPC